MTLTSPAVPLCPACALRENRFTFQIMLASDCVTVVPSPPTPLAPVARSLEPPPVPDEVLTYSVAEAAKALGVSLPTIYRLIARRILKPLPGLRTKRLSKRRVLAYLSSTEP